MAANRHQVLLSEYVDALAWAVAEATSLRAEDFEELKSRFEGDVARAAEAFEKRGPLVADPYIVGAVREYWLKCQALNADDPSEAVDCETFVRSWLREQRPDLADVIAQFPYWPMGKTADGEWI
jgi:hypothetical protein